MGGNLPRLGRWRLSCKPVLRTLPRANPRPRRAVPTPLLLGLRPLFRYSAWRGAWVLRGIGEDHGPVLVPRGRDALGRKPPKRSRLARKRSPAKTGPRPVSVFDGEGRRPSPPSEPTSHRPRLTRRQRELPVLALRANPREPRRSAPSGPQAGGPRRSDAASAQAVKPSGSRRVKRPRSARTRAHRGPRLKAPLRPRPRLGRPRAAGARRAVLAGLGVALVAAAAAIAVVSTGGGAARKPSSGLRVTAGVLELPVPHGWARAEPTAAVTLGLVDAVALSTTPDPTGTLIVGRAAAISGQLPPELTSTLAGTPAPQLVTLGGARYYRYLDLTPRSGGGSESVYTLPTTAGTMLAVCVNHAPGSDLAARCERVLSAARLTPGTLAANPQSAYAAAFRAVIRKLDVVRVSATQRFNTAPNAPAQAAAAATLASAHSEAAAALGRLVAGSATNANASVASTLRVISAAYQSLGQAATRGDAAAYAAATAKISHANVDLSSAFARLQALGYQVQ